MNAAVRAAAAVCLSYGVKVFAIYYVSCLAHLLTGMATALVMTTPNSVLVLGLLSGDQRPGCRGTKAWWMAVTISRS
jgi:hypothetical protein